MGAIVLSAFGWGSRLLTWIGFGTAYTWVVDLFGSGEEDTIIEQVTSMLIVVVFGVAGYFAWKKFR